MQKKLTQTSAEVWSQANCPACEQAKQMLTQAGYELSVRVMGHNTGYTKKDLFEKIPNAKSVPQIIIDDKVIGGLPELKKYLQINDNYKTTTLG